MYTVYVICDMIYAMFDMIYAIRYMLHDICYMIYHIWLFTYHIWHLIHDASCMIYDMWHVTCDLILFVSVYFGQPVAQLTLLRSSFFQNFSVNSVNFHLFFKLPTRSNPSWISQWIGLWRQAVRGSHPAGRWQGGSFRGSGQPVLRRRKGSEGEMMGLD